MATNFPVRGGTGNAVIVQDSIANEALNRLISSLLIPKLVEHNYQDLFSNKTGDQITIKLATKAIAGEGRELLVNPLVDEYVTMKVNIKNNIGYQFTADDMTLDISDFGNRYLKAGTEELAYKFDIAGGTELHAGMVHLDGTVGMPIDVKGMKLMQAHWTQLEMPPNQAEMVGLVNPMELVDIDTQILDLHANAPVHDIIRSNYKGNYSDFRLYQTNHLPRYVIHDYGTAAPLVNYNVAADSTASPPVVADSTFVGSMLPTDGWGTTAKKILNKGQLITIAGVNEVQPRGDREDIGHIKTFVVTEDVSCSSTGVAVIPIHPSVNDGTLTKISGDGKTRVSLAAYKNSTKAAANDAVITVVGVSSAGTEKGKKYRQSMFFHKSVMQYANIQMETSPSYTISQIATDEYTGLSILISKYPDGPNLGETTRGDTLAAVKVTRPEVGIRYITEEV